MAERYVHEHTWTDDQLHRTLLAHRERQVVVRRETDELAFAVGRIQTEIAHRQSARAEASYASAAE